MIAWTPRLAQSQDETEAVSTPPRRNVLSANPRFEMSFLPSLILSFLLVLHSLIVSVCVCIYAIQSLCGEVTGRPVGTTALHHGDPCGQMAASSIQPTGPSPWPCYDPPSRCFSLVGELYTSWYGDSVCGFTKDTAHQLCSGSGVG